jgi:hypothetical protein
MGTKAPTKQTGVFSLVTECQYVKKCSRTTQFTVMSLVMPLINYMSHKYYLKLDA